MFDIGVFNIGVCDVFGGRRLRGTWQSQILSGEMPTAGCAYDALSSACRDRCARYGRLVATGSPEHIYHSALSWAPALQHTSLVATFHPAPQPGQTTSTRFRSSFNKTPSKGLTSVARLPALTFQHQHSIIALSTYVLAPVVSYRLLF